MNTEEKIQNEKRNIAKFSKNPALQRAEKEFYLKMFRENIKRLQQKQNIHQEKRQS